MAFRPPDTARARERLLIYGGEKVGKSSCWLDIARLAAMTRSPAKFYVLDTDFAVEASLEAFPEIEDRVIYRTPDTWADIKRDSHELLGLVKPDDFLVIDLIDVAWSAVQEWWVDEVNDSTLDDYFAMVRRLQEASRREFESWEESGGKGKRPRKGTDYDFGGIPTGAWTYITKGYLAWELPLTKRAPCHVIAVAGETSLTSAGRKTEVDDDDSIYTRVGFKPTGQKRMGHRFHTIVRVKRLKKGAGTTPNVTVIEDRRRREKGAVTLSEGKMEGFAKKVLMDKWGWRL